MSKFESEIVSMTAKMLNADAAKAHNPEDEVCGTMTFGGSESIMMAMKVYRDRARPRRASPHRKSSCPIRPTRPLTKPAMYFGIKMVHVPVSEPDFRVDPAAVKRADQQEHRGPGGQCRELPLWPDRPPGALSDMALNTSSDFTWTAAWAALSCPGSKSWATRFRTFDFRLPGVTSMSADTHKYGFGLKGTSVVLYRNNALGATSTSMCRTGRAGCTPPPPMPGSRSGGLTASTWASMVYLGEEGYLETARPSWTWPTGSKGVTSIPELTIIGEPTFVISFRSEEVDIYHVNDFMETRGWRFNCLQLPRPCIFV